MEYYDDNDKEPEEINQEQQEQETQTSQEPQTSYYASGNRPQPKPTNRMALASMICGIIGLLALCGCISFPISIILGVAAICLSIFSKKGQPFTGYAIAGLVLGIISLILGVAEGLYIIAVNFMLRDPNMAPIFDQILEQYSGTTTLQ